VHFEGFTHDGNSFGQIHQSEEHQAEVIVGEYSNFARANITCGGNLPDQPIFQ
jgi:hypothetical protein